MASAPAWFQRLISNLSYTDCTVMAVAAELEKLDGSTYQQAKRRERAIKAKYSTYPGFKVLNRTTLSCD